MKTIVVVGVCEVMFIRITGTYILRQLMHSESVMVALRQVVFCTWGLQWRPIRSNVLVLLLVFIVNLELSSHLELLFPLLTLDNLPLCYDWTFLFVIGLFEKSLFFKSNYLLPISFKWKFKRYFVCYVNFSWGTFVMYLLYIIDT